MELIQRFTRPVNIHCVIRYYFISIIQLFSRNSINISRDETAK